MPRLARLACLAVLVAAASAFLARPAHAAPPPFLSETLTTEHFQIHFTSDTVIDNGAHRTLRPWSGEFAAIAEWAYSTYTSVWGFPPHVDDGDGLIDVYVFDFARWYGPDYDGIAGWTISTSLAAQSAATIEIDEDRVREPHVVAHEVFHVLQMAMYAPAPAWFMESTAEWATFRLFDYRPDDWVRLPEPENSVDCDSLVGGFSRPCGVDGYESGGYTRWTWWQYLGERFGQGVVKETWDRVVAQGDPSYDGDDAVRDVLLSKGTTLSDVFNDYSLAVLTGGFQAENLKELTPTIYKVVATPDATKALPRIEVPVNRLATRYVSFQPPVGGEGPCYAATLSINVTLPAGSSSKPHLYLTSSKAKVPLAVSGSNATVTTAWDTCSSEAPAILSLPNASQTLDGRLFFVRGTVTVDTSKIVSGKTPPAGANITTPIIVAPTDDPAPTLFLYAPNVLRVQVAARTIGFAVYSSGAGRLAATFGATRLPDVRLRAGMNRVTVRLPKPASALAFAAKPALELTSLSPSGAKGATMVQKVTFAKPAPKTKPAAKKKRR